MVFLPSVKQLALHMNNPKAPIAVALDLPHLEDVKRIAEHVSPYVRILKIGLQTFYRDGRMALDLAKETGCELFLDVKLHDIPNTVAGACKSLSKFEPDYLTVHASGGIEMMKRAVSELPHTKITAVTVLTSLSKNDLAQWSGSSIEEYASKLAESALTAGVGAIVCSGHEVESIRAIVGDTVEIIVPGIRNQSEKLDDQERTMSLSEAIQRGSDIVVIGRPITAADDPRTAAMQFANEYWSNYEK